MFSIIWGRIGSHGDQVWHCEHLDWRPTPQLYINDTRQPSELCCRVSFPAPSGPAQTFYKERKVCIMKPSSPGPVSKSGYEFQTLHLFCTFHPRGASCFSATSWLSFFSRDRTADLDIDLPFSHRLPLRDGLL